MTPTEAYSEVQRAVALHQPVSPWVLHNFVRGPQPEIRRALRLALSIGSIRRNEDGNFVIGDSGSPPASVPSSALDVVGLVLSSDPPKSAQDSLPPGRLIPMDPPTSASPLASGTGSQTPSPHCAIRNAHESLSALEDACYTYLQDGPHPDVDKVRPAVYALLRRVVPARQEYEASGRWIRDDQQRDT